MTAWLWLLPGAGALCALAAALLVGQRELSALVPVRPAPLEGPLVVVIPARNEEARIRATLEALLREPSASLKVFVYDDRSTDETAAVVSALAERDRRLRLLRGDDDPEPTRFGKPAALGRALERLRAEGEVREGRVLFLDADVVLAEGALGGLVAAFEKSGAKALSGLPRLVVKTPVEAALVPAFVGLAGRFRPSAVHDAARPTAFLNGQLMLLDLSALDDAGGFFAVKDAVLEDVALAERLKARGHALRLCDLRAVAATRMYASLGEIVEGFGKNAVPLFGGPLACAAVGLASLALSWAAPVAALGAWLDGGAGAVFAAAMLLWAGVIGLQAALRARLEVPTWPAVLSPLVYLIVAFVLLRAAWRVLVGGEVTWRGRRYRASRR